MILSGIVSRTDRRWASPESGFTLAVFRWIALDCDFSAEAFVLDFPGSGHRTNRRPALPESGFAFAVFRWISQYCATLRLKYFSWIFQESFFFFAIFLFAGVVLILISADVSRVLICRLFPFPASIWELVIFSVFVDFFSIIGLWSCMHVCLFPVKRLILRKKKWKDGTELILVSQGNKKEISFGSLKF